MIDTFFMFFQIFMVLILIFVGVLLLFVLPTNMLFNNTKFESKGDSFKILMGSFLFLVVVSIMLYFYYHLGNNYMCNISKYYECLGDNFTFGVYLLFIIHYFLILLFNICFINALKDVIYSKKLDIYLFIFATASICLTLFNFSVYELVINDMSLLYLFVRVILYILLLSPLYTYLLINILIKPKKEKVIKNKKSKR